jgi:hypothetical protein
MNSPNAARHIPDSPAVHVAAGWLVMAIDNLRVVLPQKEVREIGLVADLTPPETSDDPEIGYAASESGDAWPAYSLSGALDPQTEVPPSRRFCVFFWHAGVTLGLACDRIWSLANDSELQVEPLRACMRGLRTPITGIARYNDELATVTDAAALASYLDFLKEHRDGANE